MLYSLHYFNGNLFIWKEDSKEFIIKRLMRDGGKLSFKEEIIPFPIKNCIKCGIIVAGKCFRHLYAITESCVDLFETTISEICQIKGEWKINLITSFQTEQSIFENVFMPNGYTLFWTENNYLKVYMFQSVKAVNTSSCLAQTVPCSQKVEKLLQVSDIDLNSKYVESVNGLLLLCWKCDNEISIGILVGLLYGFKPVHILSINHFVPEIYKSIISAIKITVIVKNWDHCLQDLNDASNFDRLLNCTVICTEKKQFIIFVNGILKYSCNIPYLDVYDILRFDYCLNLFQTFYILQSSKGSCAVKKCDRLGLLKIHCCWDDSLTVLSGDFCQNGSLQLMFLANYEPELITETCIVTDIYTVYYPQSIENLEFLQESECSYALEGMKRRLKAGKITLSEIRAKQIDLQSTIEKVFNNLECNNSSDEGQKIIDEDLIDLISSKPKSFPILEERLCLNTITIIGKWNVLLKDHWILGWTLLNYNELFISNINVHLYHKKEIMEYSCKWYKHESTNNHCKFDFAYSKVENVELKQGEIFSVVVSVPLSVFTNFKICIMSYVKWKSKATLEQNAIEKCTPLQWNVLNIKKNFDGNSFKGLNFEQKIMSLRILQENQIIGLTSLQTDLSWLDGLLCKSINLEVNCMSKNLSSKVYIFTNPWNPIFGGNFSIRLISPSEAEINFYFRETTQLLIFTHWLQNLLPDDISIRTVKDLINVDRESQNLKFSLKEELQLILSFVHENSIKNNEKCQFDRQLNQVYLDNLVLDFKEYSNFRFKLLEKELETDENVAWLSL